MSNTSDFLLLKEDHTLGNLLSEHLKQAPHVMMAGYKSTFFRLAPPSRLPSSTPFHPSHSPLLSFQPVGHPNVPEVLIRIQTDGSITPREALVGVCKQLVAAYGQLGREFQKELALRQFADQGAGADGNAGGVGGGQNGGF